MSRTIILHNNNAENLLRNWRNKLKEANKFLFTHPFFVSNKFIDFFNPCEFSNIFEDLIRFFEILKSNRNSSIFGYV